MSPSYLREEERGVERSSPMPLILKDLSLSGIGTRLYKRVAGFHRASPSTALDKRAASGSGHFENHRIIFCKIPKRPIRPESPLRVAEPCTVADGRRSAAPKGDGNHQRSKEFSVLLMQKRGNTPLFGLFRNIPQNRKVPRFNRCPLEIGHHMFHHGIFLQRIIRQVVSKSTLF